MKSSAAAYDAAFKNTASIAAQELVQKSSDRPSLNSTLDKKYFIAKYGSLKNAKAAYREIYGKQKYGRSWAEFIVVAKKLTLPEPNLTLEQRVTRLENFLSSLGYQL